MFDNLKHLSNAMAHVNPVGLTGGGYHRNGLGNAGHQSKHGHAKESEREHDRGYSHN